MKQPQWTKQFIADAIAELNNLGYECEIPNINWRKPTVNKYNFVDDTVSRIRRKDSSGVTYQKHITICLGSDRVDAKLVILHEIAHWALPWKEHHSPRFWDLAWWLYRKFNMPIRYCLEREKQYRKEAVKAYRRSI